MLSGLVKNRVFVQRSGLARGLKRRGGFSFLPFRNALTPEQRFLENLNLTHKTVYDIGAYIGLLTIFFARKVGAAGNVIAFEPNPENYAALLDHLNLNGFKHVKAIPLGLGSRSETRAFVIEHPARGTFQVERQKRAMARKKVRSLHLRLDTLDHQIALHNLPAPNFVKMDVEGYELDVLQGMTETIGKHKPDLFIELHGVREHAVVDFLLNQNYTVYQVEDGIFIGRKDDERVHGHLYARASAP